MKAGKSWDLVVPVPVNRSFTLSTLNSQVVASHSQWHADWPSTVPGRYAAWFRDTVSMVVALTHRLPAACMNASTDMILLAGRTLDPRAMYGACKPSVPVLHFHQHPSRPVKVISVLGVIAWPMLLSVRMRLTAEWSLNRCLSVMFGAGWRRRAWPNSAGLSATCAFC